MVMGEDFHPLRYLEGHFDLEIHVFQFWEISLKYGFNDLFPLFSLLFKFWGFLD